MKNLVMKANNYFISWFMKRFWHGGIWIFDDKGGDTGVFGLDNSSELKIIVLNI